VVSSKVCVFNYNALTQIFFGCFSTSVAYFLFRTIFIHNIFWNFSHCDQVLLILCFESMDVILMKTYATSGSRYVLKFMPYCHDILELIYWKSWQGDRHISMF